MIQFGTSENVTVKFFFFWLMSAVGDDLECFPVFPCFFYLCELDWEEVVWDTSIMGCPHAYEFVNFAAEGMAKLGIDFYAWLA